MTALSLALCLLAFIGKVGLALVCIIGGFALVAFILIVASWMAGGSH